MTNPKVVIRKYGNRRLYDTSASRYIKLTDIAAMVRNGTDIRVEDVETGEDLTRQTLTQIVVEHAKDEPSSVPTELLRELIAVTDDVGREFLGWYLRSAFDTYRKVQNSLRDRIESPLDALRQFLPAPNREVEELRARVAELEGRAKPKKITKPKTAAKKTVNPKARSKKSGA